MFTVSGSPRPVPGPAHVPVYPSSFVPVPHPGAACYPLALALFTLLLLGIVLGAAPLFFPFLSRDRCPPLLPCPVAPVLSCAPPSTRVYTPSVSQQPCGAGGKDRFVPLAQVAPLRTPAFVFSPLFVVCVLIFFWGSFFCAHPWATPPPHFPSVCLCLVPWFPVFFFCTLLPTCTQDTVALGVSCCGSSLVRSLVLSPPWRLPLGSPRSSQVGAPPLRHPLSAPRPTPPLVAHLSPVPLLLLTSRVCAALLLSASGLYPARPHVSPHLRPILCLVGRFWRPPQVPLRGDSLVVCPSQPRHHQFPDGGAGRPVRLHAGHWHGVDLRAMSRSCLPFFSPLCPSLRVCLSCAVSTPAPPPLRLLPPASLSLPCRPNFSLSLQRPLSRTHFPHPASQSCDT